MSGNIRNWLYVIVSSMGLIICGMIIESYVHAARDMWTERFFDVATKTPTHTVTPSVTVSPT